MDFCLSAVFWKTPLGDVFENGKYTPNRNFKEHVIYQTSEVGFSWIWEQFMGCGYLYLQLRCSKPHPLHSHPDSPSISAKSSKFKASEADSWQHTATFLTLEGAAPRRQQSPGRRSRRPGMTCGGLITESSLAKYGFIGIPSGILYFSRNELLELWAKSSPFLYI